jgi:hypothetical protein
VTTNRHLQTLFGHLDWYASGQRGIEFRLVLTQILDRQGPIDRFTHRVAIYHIR